MINEYSLDSKAVNKSRLWNSLYLILYLFIELGLLLMLVVIPFLPNSRWVGPEYWKILYFLLTCSFLILAIFTTRLLIRFNKYCKQVSEAFTALKVSVLEDQLILKSSTTEVTLLIAEIELHNYQLNYGSKNPFWGQGYLEIIDSEGRKIVIPSLVFHYSVGYYTIRDLLKSRENYFNHKTTYKELMSKLPITDLTDHGHN